MGKRLLGKAFLQVISEPLLLLIYINNLPDGGNSILNIC